jgi:RNA polymerase-interacting CarD/CdnL/TRCF family regulator
MLCYVVRTQDLTIWVNADESGTSSIRPPTPETEFEKLFAILCSPGEPLPSGWYDRKNYLFERMKEGDLTSICYVIRDLTMHRRVKKFNDSDKNILDRAQSLLITEWMYSRSVSWTQARDELTRLLE